MATKLLVQAYRQDPPTPANRTFKIPDLVRGGLYEVREHTAELTLLGAPFIASSGEQAWAEAKTMHRYPALKITKLDDAEYEKARVYVREL